MPSAPPIAAVSKPAIWTGRVLSAFVVLLLSFDAGVKFMKPVQVVDALARLGVALALDIPIGVILLTCTVICAIPRTSIFVAILLTGYLGGAAMTHLRAGDPPSGPRSAPLSGSAFICANRALVPLSRSETNNLKLKAFDY